jgi:hypothetical protein
MLARNTDPVSSHEAADNIVSSGKLAQQKAVVLKALRMFQRAHGPATSAEPAKHYEMDRYMVAKRLPDLEKMDLVRKSDEMKKCSVGGKRATAWEVA